jgi:hypothetical protein
MKRLGILSCPWSASRVLSPAPSARLEPAGPVVPGAAVPHDPGGSCCLHSAHVRTNGSTFGLRRRAPEHPRRDPRSSDELSRSTPRAGLSGPLEPAHRLRRGDARPLAHPSPALRVATDLASPDTRSPKRPGAESLRDRCVLVSSSARSLRSTRLVKSVDRSSLALELRGSHTSRPSLGFPPLRRLRDAGSDSYRDYLTRLRYVFRFSQPRDVLFRPHPHGLISCRIRPWG